jgi:hypothetical protein
MTEEELLELKEFLRLVDNGNYHKGAMLEHMRKAVKTLLELAVNEEENTSCNGG